MRIPVHSLDAQTVRFVPVHLSFCSCQVDGITAVTILEVNYSERGKIGLERGIRALNGRRARMIAG